MSESNEIITILEKVEKAKQEPNFAQRSFHSILKGNKANKNLLKEEHQNIFNNIIKKQIRLTEYVPLQNITDLQKQIVEIKNDRCIVNHLKNIYKYQLKILPDMNSEIKPIIVGCKKHGCSICQGYIENEKYEFLEEKYCIYMKKYGKIYNSEEKLCEKCV
eukprot:Pgem_evm1s18935